MTLIIAKKDGDSLSFIFNEPITTTFSPSIITAIRILYIQLTETWLNKYKNKRFYITTSSYYKVQDSFASCGGFFSDDYVIKRPGYQTNSIYPINKINPIEWYFIHCYMPIGKIKFQITDAEDNVLELEDGMSLVAEISDVPRTINDRDINVNKCRRSFDEFKKLEESKNLTKELTSLPTEIPAFDLYNIIDIKPLEKTLGEINTKCFICNSDKDLQNITEFKTIYAKDVYYNCIVCINKEKMIENIDQKLTNLQSVFKLHGRIIKAILLSEEDLSLL